MKYDEKSDIVWCQRDRKAYFVSCKRKIQCDMLCRFEFLQMGKIDNVIVLNPDTELIKNDWNYVIIS